MGKKRYTIKTACPQCGCSQAQSLSKEELQEKYGNVPNIEVECDDCLLRYDAKMKDACPEWDDACSMNT